MANKRTTIAASGAHATVEVTDIATVKVGDFVFELPADETIGVDAPEVTFVTNEPLAFAVNGTVSTKVGLTTVELPARGKARVTRPKQVSRRAEPQ